VRHAKPLTIGLNCSFGAEQLRPHVQLLSDIADTYLMAYPNAGLPNDLGEYDELPETTAALTRVWAENGRINALGGCCGSTPAHIAAMAAAVEGWRRVSRRARSPTCASRGSSRLRLRHERFACEPRGHPHRRRR
jgi:hypothetical protein